MESFNEIQVTEYRDHCVRLFAIVCSNPCAWSRFNAAISIGNGLIGGSFVGGLAQEALAFNDVSLWIGNETVKRLLPGIRQRYHRHAGEINLLPALPQRLAEER